VLGVFLGLASGFSLLSGSHSVRIVVDDHGSGSGSDRGRGDGRSSHGSACVRTGEVVTGTHRGGGGQEGKVKT